jgi:GAF domain-containing protein
MDYVVSPVVDLPPVVDAANASRHAREVVLNIEGAMHAAVLVTTEDEPPIFVSTDDGPEVVGTASDEPVAVVLRTGRIVRVPTVERNIEYPSFVAKCRRLRISSVAAFPITDGALRTVGVLTVSSADHHGFGAQEIRAGRLAAEQLGRDLATG